MLVCSAACARTSGQAGVAADAGGPQTLSVRVPAALLVSRGLDSLSVSVDPASLAPTTIAVDAGMQLGVESHITIYPLGQPRPAQGRHGLSSGTEFDLGVDTWNAAQDGIPARGTRYVVDADIALFETDVAPGRGWDPHAGRFKTLWERSIHQAEE
jgi:hypothetical protein